VEIAHLKKEDLFTEENEPFEELSVCSEQESQYDVVFTHRDSLDTQKLLEEGRSYPSNESNDSRVEIVHKI